MSRVSDEQLATMIAREYLQFPEDFSSVVSNEVIDSKEFLLNTSGRAIAPMKKWL